MRTIGITGGVGAGKTTVLDFLKENTACEIIFADDLAKELCKKGEICYFPLVNLLSEDVLDATGEIDRKKMADMIFSDDGLRKFVNYIIHPAVKEYILNRIAFLKENGDIDFLFVEAALLIEDGYKEILDEIWYIYADEGVRAKRLKETRGYSDIKIKEIMKSQLSHEEFLNNTDFMIDNSEGDRYKESIKERLALYERK